MTGKPDNPYLHAPTHGGNFDANNYNRPSRQLNDTNPSNTWAPWPSHGGDFDANEFNANRDLERNQPPQSSSPWMASTAVQRASNSRNVSNGSNQLNSEPTRGLPSSNLIPMKPLLSRSGTSSRQGSPHKSSAAHPDSIPANDPAASLAPINPKSPLINPVDSSDDAIPSNKVYYHRDILRRSYAGRRDDRFLNPKDGRPSELKVHCCKDVYRDRFRSEASWKRTQVVNKSSWLLRISHWAMGEYAVVKWLPACIVLGILTLRPIGITAKQRNHGFFDPFPYKDWKYAYDARNKSENRPLQGTDDMMLQTRMDKRSPSQPSLGKIERISKPKYLCLESGMELINVDEWKNKHNNEPDLKYIFVSYTSSQFQQPQSGEEKFFLNRVGQHAARTAGVKAYWVGCSCLGSTTEEIEENVWRICDVVRGAISLVIVLRDRDRDRGRVDLTVEGQLSKDLVRQWSSRVWILPELLLSPENDDIMVYTTGLNLQLHEPQQRNRRNFPQYWDDDSFFGQLIDHYEGSVILSPLELTTTALLCLQNRQTTEYLPGDLSYALMGLLRQRPSVCPLDSAFQAFARLSLANDSNMLLERLICLLPKSPSEPWQSLQDHWGASLWDIYPKTQVCGIGDNDSVVLDGARAANIRWKSFARINLRGNDTVVRKLARIAISIHAYLLIAGFLTLYYGGWLLTTTGFTRGYFSNMFGAIGGGVIGFALVVTLSLPASINKLYFGKVWSAQPWFLGLEGYMSLPDLEKHVFGADLGRLSWSTTGSSLSQHEIEDSQKYRDYCKGKDPNEDPAIKDRINKALTSKSNEEKIFTLVDTYTMTVTLFAATKPPVAVVMCGEEGGMQRALLCSYDWTDNTLYRETVLRMETRAYWRMNPVGRIRLSLRNR